MPYTTPVTDWAAGDPVLNTDMNRIEENIRSLHEPPSDDVVLDQGADYTSNSTSFTNIDGTILSIDITTTGGDILLVFTACCRNAGGQMYFDFIRDDTTRVGGDDGVCAIGSALASTLVPGVPFVAWRLISGIGAGTYNFKVQWKVSAGTGVLYAGAGTSGGDIHGQFLVREIS